MREELTTALTALSPKERSKVIVAYEPLWAIGKTAAFAIGPNDLTEMTLYIRKVLAELLPGKSSSHSLVLYGGSVEPSEVRDLAAHSGVDGFLVGHASVDPSIFSLLVKELAQHQTRFGAGRAEACEPSATFRSLKIFLILVRAALNVPVENGKVVNGYRLRRALPTIRYLTERGARVVLISHIGEKGTETLAPVARRARRNYSQCFVLSRDLGARARSAIRDLSPGNVLVLENLRRNRVVNRRIDPAFARELAALADIFVQDSFDTCHRRHASIVGVPELLPSYAGLLLEEEVRELSRALAPAHPALAVIGGAKFSTKEPVLTDASREI